MPLPIPNLDDRSYDELLKEAREQISRNLNNQWTDQSPGDPGIVLLEAFAYLTEQMIYRLNRLPRKAYISFLRLVGVKISPPQAAAVDVQMWNQNPMGESVRLPRGCLVSSPRGLGGLNDGGTIFTTVTDLVIPETSTSEQTAVSVAAVQCQWVEESLGKSQGIPGQVFQVKNAPIVAQLLEEADWMNLKVGVEVPDGMDFEDDRWYGADGKQFHLWREVENFSDEPPDRKVYRADRHAGLIEFDPAAWGAAESRRVPSAGCEIRVWYSHGGGARGNLAPRQLNTLLSVPGGGGPSSIALTNSKAAKGGMDQETLEMVLARGPREIAAQHRAVTAHEFSTIVENTRQVARVLALPQAALWQHAVPGMVDIVMVPQLKTGQPVTLDQLIEAQRQADLKKVRAVLRDRSPIGIRSQLRWARYKQVRVKGLVSYRGSMPTEVIQHRLAARLGQFLSPLRCDLEGEDGGWPFGQKLRVADIYNLISRFEEAPLSVTSLSIQLVDAPRNISCLAADENQPHTWYAGSGEKLFRTTNDGNGWEMVLHLTPDWQGEEFSIHQMPLQSEQGVLPKWISQAETVRHVCPNPNQSGLVAVSSETSVDDELQSPLYLSCDCGENWYPLHVIQSKIEDMAWLVRGSRPALLLATESGLLEAILQFTPDGRLTDVNYYPVTVLLGEPKYPVYALAVIRSERGSQLVVAAVKGRRGLWMAPADSIGMVDHFDPLIVPEKDFIRGEDIRHLNVQHLDNRVYLWAAMMAVGNKGQGCYRWQVDANGRIITPGEWVSEDWTGGSCLKLAFDEEYIYAATFRSGLLRARVGQQKVSAWEEFPEQGLPLIPTQFEGEDKEQWVKPVVALGSQGGVVLAGNRDGIFRRLKRENNFNKEFFKKISQDMFVNLEDEITIPPDWLWLLVTDPQESPDIGLIRQ